MRCRPGRGAASRAVRRCRASSPRRAGRRATPRSPSRAGFTACQMSMNGWPVIRTCGPTAERRDLVGDPALLGAGDEVVDQHPDPPAGAGAERRAGARPGRRRRRGTPRRRPRAAGRRPTPAPRARRRAGPRRRSGSAARPGPSRRGRRRSRRRCASAWRGAAALDRRDQDDRLAVEQEARAERERAPPPPAVLQGDGVEVAVDLDDLAAEVGGDLLDDLALHRGRLDSAAALGRAPVGGEDVGAVPVAWGSHPPTLGAGVSPRRPTRRRPRSRRRPRPRLLGRPAALHVERVAVDVLVERLRPAGCPRRAAGPPAGPRRGCRGLGLGLAHEPTVAGATRPTPAQRGEGRAVSDQRQPLLAAGQVLVRPAYAALETVRSHGHSPASSASASGTPRPGQVADRLGDHAELVALLARRTRGRPARRARARPRSRA